jgi:hypothetical protein
MSRGSASIAAAAALALVLGGCGLSGGSRPTRVSVNVTRDFGSAAIGTVVQKSVPGDETVMQLLRRSFKVVAAGRGRLVESIDGHSSGAGAYGWSYYVNGILPAKRAAATGVHPGDKVWWDLHDTTAADQIPAVVGSYPEPFTTGLGGRRFPTVLQCGAGLTRACNIVAASLHRAGVKVADQFLGGGSGSDSLAILVGTWKQLHGVIAADLIAAGPSHSGVYAQFVGADGKALELDNAQGDVVRTLRAGGGLIAATEQPSLNEPTWLVTGTDVAGVEAAAAALTPARLHDHFALAVEGSQDLPLPR